MTIASLEWWKVISCSTLSSAQPSCSSSRWTTLSPSSSSSGQHHHNHHHHHYQDTTIIITNSPGHHHHHHHHPHHQDTIIIITIIIITRTPSSKWSQCRRSPKFSNQQFFRCVPSRFANSYLCKLVVAGQRLLCQISALSFWTHWCGPLHKYPELFSYVSGRLCVSDED